MHSQATRVEREVLRKRHGTDMDVFGPPSPKRYCSIDIMQERGIDADAAAQVLAEDRNAYVADEEDAHPEEHPFTDEFINPLWRATHTPETILLNWTFFLKMTERSR